MLMIDIRTQSHEIAKIEATCKSKDRHTGRFVYNVTYTKGSMVLKFTVKHVRVEGIAKLLVILAKKIQGETKKYYTIPADKIVKKGKMRLIRMTDIPKNYSEEFGMWMNGQTCGMIRGKVAVYLEDLERWIAWHVAGVTPFFD